MQHGYEGLDRAGGFSRVGHVSPLRHRDFRVLWALDRSRLAVRASHERLRTALGEVERIAIVRREAGAFPETWDLHELARELRKPGLD